MLEEHKWARRAGLEDFTTTIFINQYRLFAIRVGLVIHAERSGQGQLGTFELRLPLLLGWLRLVFIVDLYVDSLANVDGPNRFYSECGSAVAVRHGFCQPRVQLRLQEILQVLCFLFLSHVHIK